MRRSHGATMQLRGGADSAPPSTMVTVLLLAAWYAASVVNNQSSKALVALLGAEALTLSQLLVAAVCGSLVLRRPPVTFGSHAQLTDTAVLAAAFLAGCYTLNACLARMHVSLAMVLRSLEPLTTLVLGLGLLPAAEQPPRRRAAALAPVVAGCALSAAGPAAPGLEALLLVGAAAGGKRRHRASLQQGRPAAYLRRRP